MSNENPQDRRAETANQNDDSEIIENIEETPDQQGSSGGNLARDVGTQAAEERVQDPEAHEGVTKADDIAHAQRYAPDRPPD